MLASDSTIKLNTPSPDFLYNALGSLSFRLAVHDRAVKITVTDVAECRAKQIRFLELLLRLLDDVSKLGYRHCYVTTEEFVVGITLLCDEIPQCGLYVPGQRRRCDD